MKRSFLEEFGIEKDVIDKIMEANGRDINKAKADSDSEALLEQINDLKIQLEEREAQHRAELVNTIKNNAVSMALLKANAKTEKAVKALIDMELVKVDDKGKVSGLEEQLEKLTQSEDTKYLFESIEPVGVQIGNSPSEPNVDLENMNYSQMCAYMENNNI